MHKYIDLVGKRFGRLLVIEKVKKPKHVKSGCFWKCRCDCGNEKIINGTSLKKEKTKSCGCLHKEISKIYGKKNLFDISGNKYGFLTAIKYEYTKAGRTFWSFLCDCGKIKNINSSSVTGGNTISCGCYVENNTSEFSKKKFKEASFNAILSSYKYRANKRNLDFELGKDYFKDLINSNCHYCGEKPSNVKINKSNGSYVYNGIDRINPLKGYILGNVVSCCKVCNASKNIMSKDEFLEWIEQVYNHSIKNKSLVS